ncbi:MAG: DUF4384 domain-containing protein [Okeania sp. SIO3I5]|uniref:DUF4384 domain-containing protein n=1 Tax=Okeania sp. SIO3I5 TaxID=2607805 RepID=UPI0013B8FAAD|nr:DUF4384 domain-containing protein [Okeania sp. SIO3I5]NEQ38718.1 DUF4384 domain-containing protein [Okeania sp. SIO3I5]
MNKSYEYWESEFLNAMVIKFEFSGNNELAFIQRLLLDNSHKDWSQLSSELQKKENYKFSSNTLRDCWHKKIYPMLKKYGFDYQDGDNPDGKYQKTWEGARKWLKEEIFPKYIENLRPQTTIEIWKKLWEKSEDSSNIYIKEYTSENYLPHLGIKTKTWSSPKPDYLSFSIGTKINYHVKLSNDGYLIVAEKFASGEIYCIAPSVLSPSFPAWGTLILPKDKDDPFVVEPPIGDEEIIAVFSKKEPQLDWLSQLEDEPLELEKKHLESLLNYVNKNNCHLMRYKYSITS